MTGAIARHLVARETALGLFLCAVLATFGLAANASEVVQPAAPPHYVGSKTCATCHQAQFEAWRDSHHGWALREPTEQNVLGDFNDAHIEHKGVVSRFFREGDTYFVETDGADGKLARFRIRYVVGVAPLQQYLVELDGGRLQALDIVWDTVAKRWFHLYPNEDVSAGNGLHWTGPYKNWQARCAVCHQTDFRKNYEPKSRTYQSSWSELTIGCEACHGPGEAHAAWAEKGVVATSRWPSLLENGLQKPQSASRQAIEQNICGPCHSRRDQLGPDSTPPRDHFANHYLLSEVGGGLYFPDGQQDQEVYILGSFLQSKMHEKGVTCSNCHDLHSAKLLAEGNAICTQCHNNAGRPDFPSLVLKDYDSPDHHHHREGSSGARCVSCHMPERTYMVVDGRRDHFFRIPDPELSQKVGSPDACLSCHAGKTADWAASAIRSWAPDRVPTDHSAGLLFAEVRRNGLSAERMWALAAIAQDDAKPDIVRMSALRDMGDQVDPATAVSLAGLLSDGSDLVRSAVVRLWRTAPAAERVKRLQPLLGDPARTVRVAAALELTAVPPEDVPAGTREALSAALDELRASMAAKSDFPEGQIAIGGLAMTTRNWPAAQAAFAEAVFMDPQLVEIWLTRARIAAALGDPTEAAAILTTARTYNPRDISVAAELAQLLMGQGRLADAVSILKDIVAARPDDLDSRLNLAFVLLQTGDTNSAGVEIDLLRAKAGGRAEVMILHGLYQVAMGDLPGGRETVREIKRRYPLMRLPPQLETLSGLP